MNQKGRTGLNRFNFTISIQYSFLRVYSNLTFFFFLNPLSRLESSYNFVLAWSIHQHCLFSHRVSALLCHAYRTLGPVLAITQYESTCILTSVIYYISTNGSLSVQFFLDVLLVMSVKSVSKNLDKTQQSVTTAMGILAKKWH